MTLGDATHRSDFRSMLGDLSGVVKGPTARPERHQQLASDGVREAQLPDGGRDGRLRAARLAGVHWRPESADRRGHRQRHHHRHDGVRAGGGRGRNLGYSHDPGGHRVGLCRAETAIPAGWYLCDGSLKSRTGDARLFAAIGTTYNTGGEAADQFRLPDFRGRVRAMVDKGAGRLTGYNLGIAGGAETHTLTAAQMPTHTHADSGHNHGYSDPGHNHGLNQSSHQHALYPTGTEQGGNAGCGCTGGGGVLWDQGNWIAETDWRQSGDYNSGSGIGIAIATNYANLANTGGGTAHPNVQPTLAVNAIIKA